MPTNPTEIRLNELEAKWLNGTINPEEAKEYAEWYNADQDKMVEIPTTFAASKEEHAKRMLGFIQPKSPRITFMYVFGRVAAVLLIALGLWIFENKSLQKEKESNTQANRFKNDVAPGHSGAILTLSNGQQIILDSTGNGLVTMDGNDKVIKKDGGLTYDAKINATATEMAYNTLTTDKGRKFELTLPDGTKVWLNAASSIRFPLNFIGNERLVAITGEAYFEVKHNADQPFKVKVGNQTIEDIGTSFNVNSYLDEAATRTTLLEGAVKVSLSNSTATSILKPGQQAVFDQLNPTIKVLEDADLDETMAWKNGTFSFRNAGINTIMRQVARWYNVDIAFQGNIKDTFVADISQQEPISKLLKLLELTDRVHFRIDGKTITVTP